MVTEEQIKEMAYQLWEQDGRPEGQDLEHYFQAKKVLEAREAASLQAPAAPAGGAAPIRSTAVPRRKKR